MKIVLLLCLFFLHLSIWGQKLNQYELYSPDKKLKLSVDAVIGLLWSVQHDNTQVILRSPIELQLASGEILGTNVKVDKIQRSTVNQIIPSPVYKKETIHNHYNQLFIRFKGDWGIIFRAYNDGVAYRLITNRKDNLTINNETASFQFEKDFKGYFPYVRDLRVKGDQFISSFEALYDEVPISGIPKDTLVFFTCAC